MVWCSKVFRYFSPHLDKIQHSFLKQQRFNNSIHKAIAMVYYFSSKKFKLSRNSRLVIALFVISLTIFTGFYETNSLDKNRKEAFSAANSKKVIQQFFASWSSSRLNGNGALPICDEGILERKSYFQQSCRLKWYGTRDTVTCFDAMSDQTNPNDKPFKSTRKLLHFIFLGDSRIRQHFYNFLKFIPDYDLERESPIGSDDNRLHQKVNVNSQILNLCVSFYWVPLLENNTKEILSQWDSDETDVTSRVILMGMSVHHIRLQDDGNGYEPYRNRLTELKPILRRITKRSTVIWMEQYSVIDDPFKAIVVHKNINNVISMPVSIHQYNLLAESILRNSGVTVWNTGSILTDEYIRGCHIQIRDDLDYKSAKAYFSCPDLLHPGFVALSQAIQLIFNEMCNGFAMSD